MAPSPTAISLKSNASKEKVRYKYSNHSTHQQVAVGPGKVRDKQISRVGRAGSPYSKVMWLFLYRPRDFLAYRELCNKQCR